MGHGGEVSAERRPSGKAEGMSAIDHLRWRRGWVRLSLLGQCEAAGFETFHLELLDFDKSAALLSTFTFVFGY